MRDEHATDEDEHGWRMSKDGGGEEEEGKEEDCEEEGGEEGEEEEDQQGSCRQRQRQARPRACP